MSAACRDALGVTMVTRTKKREHTSKLFMMMNVVSYQGVIRKGGLEPYNPAMMRTSWWSLSPTMEMTFVASAAAAPHAKKRKARNNTTFISFSLVIRLRTFHRIHTYVGHRHSGCTTNPPNDARNKEKRKRNVLDF